MRWFWMKRTTPPGIEEAQRKLEAVEGDDEKIDELERRQARILRENNLAPFVMRALRMR